VPPEKIVQVVDQYRAWARNSRPVELSFYGGNFTGLPLSELDAYIAAGRGLMAQGRIRSMRCSVRPDTISPKMARFLKENGVSTVEIGAQTMSDRLLQAMRRGHAADDTQRALCVLKEVGTTVILQFMSGYPEETSADVETTCRALREMRPDAIRIYPFIPLEGTPIVEKLRRGIVRFDPSISIERAADIFLAAQEAGIPTVRIGLPRENIAVSPYPDNLGQVVVAEALVKLFEKGERMFILPSVWKTSVSIARKTGRFSHEAEIMWQRGEN